MTEPDFESELAAFAASGVPVTVTRKDGRAFTGSVVATGERLTYSIRTGRRGRPPVVHVDDVADVEEVASE